MKIITFGEIVDAGQSVFHSVLSVDGGGATPATQPEPLMN